MSSTAAPPVGPSRHFGRDGIEVLIVLLLVTVVCALFRISYQAVGHVYLLAMIFLSMRLSLWPVLAGALFATLTWNFVFVPPHFAFSQVNFEDSMLVGAYFTMALIGGQLAKYRAAAEREKLLAESEQLHHTLLDSVSHELKTPVAVLRSAVDQLGDESGEIGSPLISEIRQATGRLDQLIHNLLNQTRLESGMLRPRMDWCDAHDLIASARRGVRERLRNHPISVTIPEHLPLLYADAPMMEQVIANLLLNAAVHTPTSARIMVETGVLEDPPRIFLSVKDDGPGIPPQLQDVIFERFQMGKSERKSGLGLGLSIVRGFMRAQGGEARAESPAGGGALFTISLPLRPNPQISDE